MALMKDPATGKIVPVPPSISMTPIENPTHIITEVNKEEKKVVATPIAKPLIEKKDSVVANLPIEVQPLVEREIDKRKSLQFASSIDRSSHLVRIKNVLASQGMDSQQQDKALHMIREILEG